MALTPRPRRRADQAPAGDWLRLSDADTPIPEPRDEQPTQLGLVDPTWPQIPDFEILGVLGRGGMGVVYKARQKELGRIVALKMLLAGAHSDPISQARFRSEGEAIARLQHPNIVQIFEVGNHNSLPYLVLEYVPGGGLDEWLRFHQPTLEESAALVEIVARALHTAHQRGLIHRDMKPANILLAHRNGTTSSRGRATPRVKKDTHAPVLGADVSTSPDHPRGRAMALPPSLGEVVPKVADFGLAKRLEDTAHLTRSGAFLGTPAYMAPEQLGTRREGVGVASDVYALGVILYEMIAGRPPYDAATPADILFQVSLRDPIPPRYWRPRLPADLERICLKCLNKEPAQRYASALDLADDLRRYLEHKPVQARPLSRFTWLGRWCRRHPGTTALMAAVAVLLLVTTAALVVGFLSVQAQQGETEKARLAALAEEQKARDALARESRHKEQLQQVLEVMTSAVLDRSQPDGSDLTPADRLALRQVAQMFKDMAAASAPIPGEQREAAISYGYLARIDHRLGEAGEAETAYRQAIEAFDRLASTAAAHAFDRRSAGMNRIELGRFLAQQKRIPDALTLLQQGGALVRDVLVDHPGDSLARQNLSVATNVLGTLLMDQGKLVEAELALGLAADLQAQLLAERPDDLELRRQLSLLGFKLAQLEGRLGRARDVEGALSFAVAILQAKPPHLAAPALYEETLAVQLNDLATQIMKLEGRQAEAEQYLIQAIRIREQLIARFPAETSYAVGLGGSCTNLGSVFYGQGRPDAAHQWHDRAVQTLMPVSQNDQNNMQARVFFRNSLVNRALALEALNRLPEAAMDWATAAGLSAIRDRPGMLARQADSLVRTPEWRKAVPVAAAAAASPEINPSVLYRLAVTFAKAASKAPEGKTERESLCQQAISTLQRADQAGLFRDPAWKKQILQEDSFELLRNRPEYHKMFGNPKD